METPWWSPYYYRFIFGPWPLIATRASVISGYSPKESGGTPNDFIRARVTILYLSSISFGIFRIHSSAHYYCIKGANNNIPARSEPHLFRKWPTHPVILTTPAWSITQNQRHILANVVLELLWYGGWIQDWVTRNLVFVLFNVATCDTTIFEGPSCMFHHHWVGGFDRAHKHHDDEAASSMFFIDW